MEQMTAQDALDSVKGITFEKAWAILMEDRRKWEAEQKEAEAKRETELKKWEAEQRKAEAKREAEQKKAEEKREAEIKKWEAEIKKWETEIKKWETEIKKREAEQKKADEKWKAEMAAMYKRTDEKLGWLSNSLGQLTEALFSGSLHTKFEKYGYVFDAQNPDKMFFENKQGVCEVDIWLENSEHVMAIEVKTNPKNADINEHIKRIAKIRRLMDKKNDKRKILAAIAGGVFKSEVRQYAHKNGFFVIVQSGESVELATPPKKFKVREW